MAIGERKQLNRVRSQILPDTATFNFISTHNTICGSANSGIASRYNFRSGAIPVLWLNNWTSLDW